MPLVDGSAATRLIRAFENTTITDVPTSHSDAPARRIPIIAVSASLSERAIGEYLDTGFDGWIHKPIDFQRLELILAAIGNAKTKAPLLHGKEVWERGGWFR